jgi:hypothetical protein
VSETKTTEWTTTIERTYGETNREQASVSVQVSSNRTARLSAWAVRDFVKALDAAEAPDTAYVQAHRSDVGHTVQLTAEWKREEGIVSTDQKWVVHVIVAPLRRAPGRPTLGLGSRPLLRWQLVRETRKPAPVSEISVWGYEHISYHWTLRGAEQARAEAS